MRNRLTKLWVLVNWSAKVLAFAIDLLHWTRVLHELEIVMVIVYYGLPLLEA